MASPQLENGYTKIAHEIIEKLITVKMSGTEWQYVMCIIRKTYGFQKKEDWITNSQVVKMTGLKKERVSEAKGRLMARNIVTEKRNKISFQKDWEQWRELRKSVTIVTEKRNSVLRKSVHTIDTITKDNILGETSSPNDMGWNNKSDDYEEGYVDLDGDGLLKEEKKPQTRKYPNAPAVRKVFQEILGKNPLDWNKNTTVLQACENLYTERGIEKIRNALEFYVENRDKEFCPVIDSPIDLDRKYTKLSRFKTST